MTTEQQPPAWGTPPSPSPAPAVAARPAKVTAAGLVMIVAGALVLALLGSAVIGGLVGGLGGAVESLILLGIGIINIVAGVNVFAGRRWARIIGIVLAAILGLFGLTGLESENGAGRTVVIVIWVAANAFIVYALAASGRWFTARSA